MISSMLVGGYVDVSVIRSDESALTFGGMCYGGLDDLGSGRFYPFVARFTCPTADFIPWRMSDYPAKHSHVADLIHADQLPVT